jgi:hypothetical protein
MSRRHTICMISAGSLLSGWISRAYDAWRSSSFSSASGPMWLLSWRRDDRGPAQKVGDFLARVSKRLAVGRNQLDVQHAAGPAARGSRRRPSNMVRGQRNMTVYSATK